MGPIEQGLVHNYSSISSRLRAFKPPARIPIVDKSIELQAKIDSLQAHLSRTQERLAIAQEQLLLSQAENIELKIKNPIQIREIKKLICAAENVTMLDLTTSRRFPKACLCRQIGYYLSSLLTDFSLPVIGRCFGYRDHTTVMHGRDKIAKLRLTDPSLDLKLKWYEEQLGKA